MARDTGPQCKQCRREGMKLFLKGERCMTDKCSVERRPYPPGRPRPRPRARSPSTASSFARSRGRAASTRSSRSSSATTTRRPAASPGVTGENLLRLLERRLDNVLVRLGFRRFPAAGAPADRPRALPGQRPARGHPLLPGEAGGRDLGKEGSSGHGDDPGRDGATATVPPWLQADYDSLTAKVLRLPERDEITAPVQEQLIVELYSK